MKEIKRLIFQILALLELVENRKNQPVIQNIRGLLYEVLDLLEKEVY